MLRSIPQVRKRSRFGLHTQHNLQEIVMVAPLRRFAAANKKTVTKLGPLKHGSRTPKFTLKSRKAECERSEEVLKGHVQPRSSTLRATSTVESRSFIRQFFKPKTVIRSQDMPIINEIRPWVSFPKDSQMVTMPDGRQVSWAEFGSSHPDAYVIVLWHSTPGCRLETAQFLQKYGEMHRVRFIQIDRLGYGDTKLTRQWPNRSMSADVEALRAVLDCQNVRNFSVRGVSGGGPYALMTAAIMETRVERVAIMAGVGHPSGESLVWDTRNFIMRLLLRISEPLWGWWMFRGVRSLDTRFEPKTRAVIRKQGLKGHKRDKKNFTLAESWDAPWQSIKAPLFWIHGTQDRNCRLRGAEYVVQRLPNEKQTWLATPRNADHYQAQRMSLELMHWLRTGNGAPELYKSCQRFVL